MRQIAIVLAVIAVSIAAVQGQDQKAGAAAAEIDKALVAQEQALYQAVAKQDKAAFQSLTVADGTWTTSSGFVPMQLLANDLSVFSLSQFTIVNPHVKRLDGDSALVIYPRTAQGTFGGQAVAPTALASTVWIRRDGTWRALHHQETELLK